MSNEIYGYIDLGSHWENAEEFAKVIKESTKLGFLLTNEIDGFPEYFPEFPIEIKPSKSNASFCITDNPNEETSTYLISPYDYAPETSTSLPLKKTERIEMLCELLVNIFRISGAIRVCVLITECSEIEEIKPVSITSLCRVLFDDFEKSAPPAILYCIGP